MSAKIKIAVAGTGYVGMSLAVLLARQNDVMAVDILPERVDMINRGLSPIVDSDIEHYLSKGGLNLRATLDAKEAYSDAQFIIVAVPTNYDEITGYFDTHHIEDVVGLVLSLNPRASIIIKSTIPIGYTDSLRMQYKSTPGHEPRIIFAPEFLREGRALYDNLYPSRIIIGYDQENRQLARDAHIYANLIKKASLSNDAPILSMSSSEAEAVKLFANSYLAMRVAFFNELDSFAESQCLNAKNIIDGISLDPRIGGGYNNPSFGYGGYCFPKDTKQMRANFKKVGVDAPLADAIIRSNAIRKEFVADRIYDAVKEGGVVGIYRLAMKSGSDNFRESAVWDIMRVLYNRAVKIEIYEPSLSSHQGTFKGYELQDDLTTFLRECDIIVANRMDEELQTVRDKVYTRDIYNNN